jgi:hypothetical protein
MGQWGCMFLRQKEYDFEFCEHRSYLSSWISLVIPAQDKCSSFLTSLLATRFILASVHLAVLLVLQLQWKILLILPTNKISGNCRQMNTFLKWMNEFSKLANSNNVTPPLISVSCLALGYRKMSINPWKWPFLSESVTCSLCSVTALFHCIVLIWWHGTLSPKWQVL